MCRRSRKAGSNRSKCRLLRTASQSLCSAPARVSVCLRSGATAASAHRKKLKIAEEVGAVVEIANHKPVLAGYQWVVDATGSPEGLGEAVQMVEPRGTVVLKSTVHQKVSIDTAPIVVNELTLVGSRCGRFEPALELIRCGKVRLPEMISARFPLSEAPAAFAGAAERGMLKVLLYPK
ncbi:MAG: zinc-binding dehydrogenase [Acidobacteria bacterium]|nr:zinc-binding dehydrogenase [Acidobacteriota bacterium]